MSCASVSSTIDIIITDFFFFSSCPFCSQTVRQRTPNSKSSKFGGRDGLIRSVWTQPLRKPATLSRSCEAASSAHDLHATLPRSLYDCNCNCNCDETWRPACNSPTNPRPARSGTCSATSFTGPPHLLLQLFARTFPWQWCECEATTVGVIYTQLPS